MKMRIIRLISALLCMLTCSQQMQSQSPGKGLITDTVKCSRVPGQSYALFLPAMYDNKNDWPLILIFDPAARGSTGVEAFIEAARRYGFILACSNNSRNGPLENNYDAAAAMLQDITERFRVNQKRIYASGFSGGSRFAMAFAMNERRIAGVVGCGAGLPNDGSILPSGAGFLYYGIAGNRDMNYPEMLALHEFLGKKAGIIPFLRTFPGGHQWPAPDIMTGSVEWLILRSMNSKIVPVDQSFISVLGRETESLINSSFSAGNIIDAVRYLKSAVRDFSGTTFESEFKLRLADTERSPGYKTAVRRWNKISENEQQSKDRYLMYLGEILQSASMPDTAANWWRKECGTLTRLRDKGSPENSQMASRLLNFISIACSEQAASFYRISNFSHAAFLFGICTFSDSENPNNYYNLARSLAQSGKIKKSVDALTAAFNHGFTSRKKVGTDPAFSSIRTDAGYKELLSKMK